jgi:hypothetical protein
MSTTASSQPDVATRLKCQVCSVLEAIHRNRTKTCVRLMEELNRSSSLESRIELEGAISKVQIELDEAWKRLGAHRRVHAFGSESSYLQKCPTAGPTRRCYPTTDDLSATIAQEIWKPDENHLSERSPRLRRKRLEPPDRRRIVKYIAVWMLGVPCSS